MSATTRPAVPHAGRGLLLVSAAGVVWGTIGPAVQVTHEASGFSPWAISAYRSVAAVLVLVLVTAAIGGIERCLILMRRHGRRVTITGVATATFQLLFFIAVLSTGVSVATVIALGLPPVLLVVVDSVHRREAPTLARGLTVAAAVAGLCLVSSGGGGAGSPVTVVGVLAAVGSGTAYAVATHAGATLSREHDALAVTTVTMSVAAAVLIPSGVVAAYVQGGWATTTDVGSWLLLTYLGVVTMAFAYVLLYAGLRSTTSGSAVIATLLEPVTAVLIAVLLLGERPTVAVVLGTLMILVAVTTLGRREGTPPPPQ